MGKGRQSCLNPNKIGTNLSPSLVVFWKKLLPVSLYVMHSVHIAASCHRHHSSATYAHGASSTANKVNNRMLLVFRSICIATKGCVPWSISDFCMIILMVVLFAHNKLFRTEGLVSSSSPPSWIHHTALARGGLMVILSGWPIRPPSMNFRLMTR